MPQLGDDSALIAVDCVGDLLPSLDLRLVPKPGSAGPAEALAADASRFGNDQACARALGVISRHQLVGHAFAARAGAGQRSHQDAVGELKGTELQGFEQRGHLTVLQVTPHSSLEK